MGQCACLSPEAMLPFNYGDWAVQVDENAHTADVTGRSTT
jgi:hypothetical protein